MKSLLQLLGNRWVLATAGVLLLSLLLWFAGPYVAFADSKPFASAAGRLVGVLVIVVVWAGVLLVQQLRAARVDRALAQATTQAAPGERGGSGDEAVLRQRFEEATAALRRKSGRSATALYQLPWYVVIGPPGSGKTTVLLNSGLEFPLSDKLGAQALRGVGGTRNCDWWFTDQAVLLDTAGRYMTQDSDRDADSAGWRAFLKLLVRYRRRRPINGVIVTVSAQDLLLGSDGERHEHVRAVRARLAELAKELGIGFPVYLLVTKVDLVSGFSEFFDDLNQEGRAQVWGATFPLELSRDGTAVRTLDAELDRLLVRLSDRVAGRLNAERDLGRRGAIFAFPQQMAGLKRRVVDFCNAVFADGTQQNVWLRGAYFTSGTQEGTPIDRMMASVARTFGLGYQPAPLAAGRGKAYFIAALLRDVIFPEAGLAGLNRRAELTRRIWNAGAYGAAASLAALGILALTVSYRSNGAYVDDVAAAVAPLEQLPASPGRNLEERLARLDRLRTIFDAAAVHDEDRPWRMRFGLFQGRSLTEVARDAYLRELNSSVVPLAADALERRLTSTIEPERLYEHLKAYLMLTEPQRLEPAQVAQAVTAEWGTLYGSDPVVLESLQSHLAWLLEHPGRIRAAMPNEALIERARVSLAQASPAVLMYGNVKLGYAGDERALRLDSELGLGANEVFVRRSGRPLSEPLPALYTRAVFDEFDRTGKLEVVSRFMADAWVLGDRAPALTQSPRLAYEVQQLYERDYVRAWSELLGDLTFRPTRDLAEISELLAVLGGPLSPLKQLLVIVDANTNFAKPAPGLEGAANQAADRLGARAAAAAGIGGGAQQAQPGATITAAFQNAHRLLQGPPGNAPIDQLIAAIGRAAAPGADGADPRRQGSATRAALGAVAAQLPGPLASALTDLGERSSTSAARVVRNDLAASYRTRVLDVCRDLVAGRYPLTPESAGDAALEDFGTVFGPSGAFAQFFQSSLAGLVDTGGQSWRWREGAEQAGAGAVSLEQLQRAQRIEQAFFSGAGATPAFNFTLTPDYLDAGTTRFVLEVDGQRLEYGHGPVRGTAIRWPGDAAGQASVAFEEEGGNRPAIVQRGPWAWFRLLDQAEITQQSPTRFLVRFSLGAHEARLLLEASSVRNPLGMREYRRFGCDG